MSDFEDIQRLIRLKRHERPPVEFVEQFVSTFQDRQRSEMLRNSARVLLWERVTTYFEGLLNPKWAWAGATAAAVIGLGFVLRPTTSGSAQQLAHNKPATSFIDANEIQTVAYQVGKREAGAVNTQQLISHSFLGGLGDEQVAGPSGQVYPAGFYVDLTDYGQRH